MMHDPDHETLTTLGGVVSCTECDYRGRYEHHCWTAGHILAYDDLGMFCFVCGFPDAARHLPRPERDR